MGMTLGPVLAILFFELVGVAIYTLVVKRKYSILLVLSFSWILGLFGSTFLLFLLSPLGISPLLLWLIALAAGSTVLRRKLRFVVRRSDLIAFLLIALLSMLLAVFEFAKPIYSFDAIAFWTAKGRAIFVDGAVSGRALKDFMSSDYPLLVPISQAANAIFVGNFDLVALKGLTLATFAGLLMLIFRSVRHFWNWKITAIVLIIFASLKPVFDLSAGEHVGEADFLLGTVFLALAIAFYFEEWLLASLLAAAAIWTKQEGAVPFVVLSIFLFAKNRKEFFRFIIAPLALFVPFFVFLKLNGIHGQYVLQGNYQRNWLGFITYPLQSFREEMRTTRLWNLTWWFFFATLLLNFKKALRWPLLPLYSIVFVQIIFYVAVFAYTPHDQATQVATTITRLVFHLLPLSIFLTAASAKDLT